MIRLDRAVTLGIAQPLAQTLRRLRLRGDVDASSKRVLPILMYHSISNDPEPGVHPYYRTVTSPSRFAQQMQWLRELGYQGMSLTTGLAWLTESSLPAPSSTLSKPVAITFDDGFDDFYTSAFPELQRRGFNATVYLSTAFIGDTRRRFNLSTLNSQLSTVRNCLTWSQVSELHSAGIEFGSHTVSHPKLVDLTWDQVDHEVRESKREIEARLGSAVSSFSYPYAFPQGNRDFTERLRITLAAAGYSSCVTTEIGRARPSDDSFRLKRLPINDADDKALFLAKLAGAYDWLSGPQRGLKILKNACARQ